MQISTASPPRKRTRRAAVCLLAASSALLSAAPFLWAQDGTSELRFEVASIRPADPKNREGSSWRTTPAGDIRVHAVPLLALIMSAYGLGDFQVLGYPAWAGSDSFDVDAKSGEEAGAAPGRAALDARLQARLRTLLAERCHLVARRATKSQPPWVLTVDRGGSKMRLAGPDPAPATFRPFALSADSMSMTEFSAALSRIIHSVVVDQTELRGAYKIDLQWAPSPETMESRKPIPGPDVPEIHGALSEQLGLRLTRRDAMVDVLIVEGIERPFGN